jgi:hypothetical protein
MRDPIQVLLVRVNKEPELISITPKLSEFQALIKVDERNPAIEWLNLDDSTTLVCDEEGKQRGLPLNRWVVPYGVIMGDFFLCRTEPGGLWELSLTDEQITRWTQKFALSQSKA